MIYRLW